MKLFKNIEGLWRLLLLSADVKVICLDSQKKFCNSFRAVFEDILPFKSLCILIKECIPLFPRGLAFSPFKSGEKGSLR